MSQIDTKTLNALALALQKARDERSRKLREHDAAVRKVGDAYNATVACDCAVETAERDLLNFLEIGSKK